MFRDPALRRFLRHVLRNRPGIRRQLVGVEHRLESMRLRARACGLMKLRPRPRRVMLALISACNARCAGCHYGRDFMPGHRLSWPVVEQVLEDCRAAGTEFIRLYGGEPLLHPDLPRMVARCVELGLSPSVTTNALLLEERMDALVEAGLEQMTIGFYGVGKAYDDYVARPGAFEKVERGIAALRERHGSRVSLQMNWLLMRPSLSIEAFEAALAFARRHEMTIQVDLIHYSLPYFQEGPDRCLQLFEPDRPRIEEVTAHILERKREEPQRITATETTIRSMTDWLLLGPKMKVPCLAGDMLWIGADGTVQLCYVTFELGNVNETRLRDLIGGAAHVEAANKAYDLDCPNCHCGSNERVMRHPATRRRYRG